MPLPLASSLPREAVDTADVMIAEYGNCALAVARTRLVKAIDDADSPEMERRAAVCFVLMERAKAA